MPQDKVNYCSNTDFEVYEEDLRITVVLVQFDEFEVNQELLEPISMNLIQFNEVIIFQITLM